MFAPGSIEVANFPSRWVTKTAMPNRLFSWLLVGLSVVFVGCAAQEQTPDITEPTVEETDSAEEAETAQQTRETRSTIERLRRENQRLKNRNQELQNSLREQKSSDEKDGDDPQNRDIASSLRNDVSAGTVYRGYERVMLSVPGDVLFKRGAANLSQEGLRILGDVAEVLKQYPERETRVQGHADTLPIAGDRFASNWELSSQRAINVLKILVYREGVDRTRIGATAFGQFRPRAPNNTPEGRSRNRRVEIVVLPADYPSEPVTASGS